MLKGLLYAENIKDINRKKKKEKKRKENGWKRNITSAVKAVERLYKKLVWWLKGKSSKSNNYYIK